MPEYLAPGVYVEETSFRSKSIEGVSTTTTGFIGPCRFGPVDLENELVTSLGEFELTYGGGQQLHFESDFHHNYLWHAVRAFFTEGGKRLYISRIFRPIDESPGVEGDVLQATGYVDGCGRALIGASAANGLSIRARYPGAHGNLRTRFTLKLGQNVLSPDVTTPTKARVTGALRNLDVAYVSKRAGTTPTIDKTGAYLVRWSDQNQRWELTNAAQTLTWTPDDLGEFDLRVVTVAVVVIAEGALVWDGLALDPNHTSSGAADSLVAKFGYDAKNPALTRSLPIVLTGNAAWNGLDVLTLLAPQSGADTRVWSALVNPTATTTENDRTVERVLSGGNDGKRPQASHYEGSVDETSMRKKGLAQFEDLEDISIVAAPGSTFGFDSGYQDGATVVNLLIAHAKKMSYRIAVLDAGDGQSLTQVRAMRARIDSSHAALYYPWIRVLDPVTRVPIFLPPSGFVAGIYARNDTNRAVYKAPANEVVNLAVGFETLLNKAQQDVLNPEGINAFRFFEGRGFRLWGARTVSSDPEWKYVNLRRYFAYLERSIDKGTQWAVFEPNGEQLWANVRRTIEEFLLNEWQSGALLGDKPEKSYFVRCDRSTMTQNDLDNGRLICLIGVAPLRPAEFVIFRIGQWTADRKS